jgi:hypothetical protein
MDENERVLMKAAHGVATEVLKTLGAQEQILNFFAFEHLPEKLQEMSFAFASLAIQVMEIPRGPERTVALRKLLEGKDAAVRASL